MTAKKVITLSEFKMALENVRDDIRKMSEVMNHRFDKNEQEVHTLKQQVGILTEDSHFMKSQLALLHKGQTEIKDELKSKVDR